ncbi:hypothetical protein [uncultured Fusobacterium sp.]|uniref:hypothetical protein n=1 Tax=uncultured Fusobacterium sp. TaxID=159267 RepID=UPI0025DBB085|nr:hypothetical protein [uncultured Fusobacterium sp.]
MAITVTNNTGVVIQMAGQAIVAGGNITVQSARRLQGLTVGRMEYGCTTITNIPDGESVSINPTSNQGATYPAATETRGTHFYERNQ